MRMADDMRRDERRVDARLLRTRDLIDLRLDAPGCTIEPTDGGAELVAGPDASLVVHFPPQHLGRGGLAGRCPATPTGERPDDRPATWPRARRRLVYELPEGTRITYTLEKVLEALADLEPAGLARSRRRPASPPRRRGVEPPARARDRDRGPLPPGRLPERARRVPALQRPRSGRTTAPSSGART